MDTDTSLAHGELLIILFTSLSDHSPYVWLSQKFAADRISAAAAVKAGNIPMRGIVF
jgi:hypothetical protein